MADRYWVGNSGNWSDNTNHWSTSSGGAAGASKPGGSDNAIIDGNSGTGTITADEAIDVLTLDFTAAQQLSFVQNGQAITVSGDATFNGNGIGGFTLDSTITMSGNNKTMLFGASIAALSAASLDIIWNGTGGTLTDNKILSARSLTLGASAGLTCGGSAVVTVFRHPTGIPIVLGDNSTLTMNTGIFRVSRNNSGSMCTCGSNITLNGTGAVQIQTGGSGVVLNVPAITYTGSGSWTLNAGSTGFTNSGFISTGNINVGANNLNIIANNTDGMVYDFDTYGIIAKNLEYGQSGAGKSATYNFGSGIIDLSGKFAVTNTGSTILNLETSTIRVAGDITFGTNTTLDAGTSDILCDSSLACAFTSAGKTFYGIVVNKTANGVAQADNLTCHDFLLTDGTYDMGGNDLTCNDFQVDSPDTKTFDGVVTAAGDVTINQDTTMTRLIMSATGDLTIASGKTLTITTPTAGDLNVASITGGTLTLPVDYVITGAVVTNSTTTNRIDAAGCIDGGGNNANWDFGGRKKKKKGVLFMAAESRIKRYKVFDSVTINNSTATSTPIDLMETVRLGYYSLHVKFASAPAGAPSVDFKYLLSNDGITFFKPTSASVIKTAHVKTSGPNSDGEDIYGFELDEYIAAYMKITATETATAAGIITAWLAVQ